MSEYCDHILDGTSDPDCEICERERRKSMRSALGDYKRAGAGEHCDVIGHRWEGQQCDRCGVMKKQTAEGWEENPGMGISLVPVQRREPDGTPGWIKKIYSSKDGRRQKIEKAINDLFGEPDNPAHIVWKKMYGCGHYGCAFAIERNFGPNDKLPYVVKITRDPTEGPMQAMIGKRQANGDYGFEAFAVVKSVFKLEPDIDWKGKKWPVYVIVREEVTPIYNMIGTYGYLFSGTGSGNVNGIYPPVTKKMAHHAIDALHKYKDLSTKWHAAVEKMKSPKSRTYQYQVDKIENEMSDQLNVITRAFPTLEVMGILQSEGTPLRDVHAHNIGVRTHPGVLDPDDPESGMGYVTIFDPGHTPSGEEIRAEEKQIVRLNRKKLSDGIIPAAEIKTIVTHPNGGLVYVSASLWNDPVFALKEHFTKDDEFVLADSSAAPLQWAEAVKAFPDAGDFRPGEWDQK